jgi:hypothetical protein
MYDTYPFPVDKQKFQSLGSLIMDHNAGKLEAYSLVARSWL